MCVLYLMQLRLVLVHNSYVCLEVAALGSMVLKLASHIMIWGTAASAALGNG